MMPASCLTLTHEVYALARKHLFPGDGLEAAAILVCSRVAGPRTRLLAHDIVLVPHAECQRAADFLRWPGASIEDGIDKADAAGHSLILLHSHPGDLFGFSRLDDQSDHDVIPCIYHAVDSLHGSAIMVSSGAMLARIYSKDMQVSVLEVVTMAHHDLRFWWADGEFSTRPMAFTSESRRELRRLSACVVGVSGTGSIVAEQLARLGFGQVVLVDFDRVEHKNLNRILNSTLLDAKSNVLKVESIRRAIDSYRGPGVARVVPETILSRSAVLEACQADVIFSCVDSQEGRQIVDLIAAFFLMPAFDVGVTIPTRKNKSGVAILDVCARVDYVRPGGPMLYERGVYTQQGVRAEQLKRTDPEQFKAQIADGYIPGANEEAPSVIALNMSASADTVLEFIARIHPFRHDGNSGHARRNRSLAAAEEEFLAESSFKSDPFPLLGHGAREPLLGMPQLTSQAEVR
ncbi:ThiF family adenylyltransferase [Acidovorax radicis]|uniref:ThiF family adenylyltransferase n=1 Tax=Acidovorax radicis TaxID=758826 RepID=UPI001CF87186|nr:ThiF family adenylyltransferase [Acidovorax radicis]UCU99248.1 ThiF family adenylyltransferase [Acidovorax radicis]